MAKRKATFGTMATCNVKYAIVKVYSDNRIKYVTDVKITPSKYCEWENGKNAKLFDDKVVAEDICFGLNANGYGCFVMEIPDYFNDDMFENLEVKE